MKNKSIYNLINEVLENSLTAGDMYDYFDLRRDILHVFKLTDDDLLSEEDLESMMDSSLVSAEIKLNRIKTILLVNQLRLTFGEWNEKYRTMDVEQHLIEVLRMLVTEIKNLKEGK